MSDDWIIWNQSWLNTCSIILSSVKFSKIFDFLFQKFRFALFEYRNREMKFCLFLFATSQGIIFDLFIQTFRHPRSETSWSWPCWRSVNLCFSRNILSEKVSKIQKVVDLPSTIMTMMIIMSLLMGVITTITIMMHLILNVEQVVQGNILNYIWVLNDKTVLKTQDLSVLISPD